MEAVGRESKRARECEGEEMKGQKNEKVIWQQGVCASEEETSLKTRAPQLVRRREYRNVPNCSTWRSFVRLCGAYRSVDCIVVRWKARCGAARVSHWLALRLLIVFVFFMSAKGGVSCSSSLVHQSLLQHCFIPRNGRRRSKCPKRACK